MTPAHNCPEPGAKIGSTVVCGVCQAYRQRALDGSVTAISYQEARTGRLPARGQPWRPEGRQEWIEIREFGSAEVKYLPGRFVPNPPAGFTYQPLRSVPCSHPIGLDRDVPDPVPPPPAPKPARTDCADCGMDDLPLNPAGRCTVCAQVEENRHQRQARSHKRRRSLDVADVVAIVAIVGSVIAVLVTTIMMLLAK